MSVSEISKSSRLIAFLLCFFLGYLGAHRFYVKKYATAVLMIVTLGGFGVWMLIDLIFILCGAFRDKEGNVLLNWFEKTSSLGARAS